MAGVTEPESLRPDALVGLMNNLKAQAEETILAELSTIKPFPHRAG